MLRHIVETCKLVGVPIFLCIPQQDRKLLIYAYDNLDGVIIWEGSELDVLDRFYQCALANDIKKIIRICADCPNLQLQDIREQEILSNSRSFSYGNNVWIFTFSELEKAWNNAKEFSQREDLCEYMMKTINYPGDLERICHSQLL